MSALHCVCSQEPPVQPTTRPVGPQLIGR